MRHQGSHLEIYTPEGLKISPGVWAYICSHASVLWIKAAHLHIGFYVSTCRACVVGKAASSFDLKVKLWAQASLFRTHVSRYLQTKKFCIHADVHGHCKNKHVKARISAHHIPKEALCARIRRQFQRFSANCMNPAIIQNDNLQGIILHWNSDLIWTLSPASEKVGIFTEYEYNAPQSYQCPSLLSCAARVLSMVWTGPQGTLLRTESSWLAFPCKRFATFSAKWKKKK